MQSVRTTLNYDGGHADRIYLGTAEYYLRQYDEVPVTIKDARGSEAQFSLDRNGFEYRHHTSAVKDWKEGTQVEDIAYSEIIQLIKNHTGASRVHPIDHRVRQDKWTTAISRAQSLSPEEYIGKKPPARMVHVDQSYDGAHAWLAANIADHALLDKLRSTRWGIINVWRPLKTVHRDPFAVSNGSTIPDKDLVVMPTYFKNGTGGNYGGFGGEVDQLDLWAVKRGEGHEWWYLSEMRSDEVVLLKCFDSKLDGRCRRAPHSAFEDERYVGEEWAARESVEIRCLVFWEDQSAE